jgi:DNA invertase Pin-like site-specific DNA recombinase
MGYIRVSTEGQAEHGVSLEAQKAKLAAYATLYDLVLMDVIVDAGVSAKTLDRPGLQRALGMLRKGQAAGLLVAKLDRLTRSVKDLGALVEQYFAGGKVALLSVAENVDTRTASGRLVLNVLGSVAQWEREAIGERTAEALAHKKTQGQKTGGDVPYGYALSADGKTLVPDAAEQALLGAIRTARQRGLSQRAVVAELTRQGFMTRKGTALQLGSTSPRGGFMADTQGTLEARRWFRRRLAEIGEQYPHLKQQTSQERLQAELDRHTEEKPSCHGNPPETPEVGPQAPAS